MIMKTRFPWIVIIVALAGVGLGLRAQTPAELLVNGGFEQARSLTPWVIETTKGGVSVSGPNGNGNPHGGNRFVLLGGTNSETDSIEQSVIIPMNTADLVLAYALRIKATGNDGAPHDFLRVSFQGEAVDDTLAQYSNAGSSDWHVVTIPGLAAYAGRLLTLRFDATTDGTKPTKFCLDDISLVYTPGANPGPTPNLEFISPTLGCLYPSPTLTGAAPLPLIADSPAGIQSLTAEIDGQQVASTAGTQLTVPINWSALTPGEHTLSRRHEITLSSN